MLADVRAAEAARGAARLLVGTSSADTGNLDFYQRCGYRLLSIERDYFTPVRGYPPDFVLNGLPAVDMVWMDLEILMGRLPRHRARCHAAARVARVPPALGRRRHHRGRIAVHPCRRSVPGVRAHRLDADGRPARARHDGAALLRFDPRRSSRGSLRATPSDPADAGRRLALRPRARAERRCDPPADLGHLRRLLLGAERLRDSVYRRAGRQCRCSCNPSTSLRRQRSRRCSAALRC